MLKPQAIGDPVRHLAARPQPAAVGRCGQALAQCLEIGIRQQRPGAMVVPPPIAEAINAVTLVAPGERIHPARRHRHQFRDFSYRVPPRQKPHDLAVGPLDNIPRGAKPRFKLLDAKMICLRHDPLRES